MVNQDTSVRVAVRIRPILGKEKVEGCLECVRPTSRTELVMEGKEKRFTFDNVFGKESQQADIYTTNVSPLVKSLFEGYNATVLAYGQTGSGKTYTMGTSNECLLEGDTESLGVIPRAMEEIFELIEEKKTSNPGAEFYLRVQFLEVYGEDIRDLLDPSSAAEGKAVIIREGGKGESVSIEGAREETVKSTQEMLGTLERGAMCRTTGSTQMNFHSSRSHAIFTIIIEQHLPTGLPTPAVDMEESTEANKEENKSSGNAKDDTTDETKDSTDSTEATNDVSVEDAQAESTAEGVEYRTAKFHFVDLAGSERAKRTGATGTRLKEGININKGLLALGNVISALGDETRQVTHVPYRDSKLTRMLQDSLGGNSRTLMIACVSPADANIEETLNALRYANRAKNIKNKPVVNRDPNSSQIAFLKAQISQLRAQLTGGGATAPYVGYNSSDQSFGAFSSPASQELVEEVEAANQRASQAEAEVLRLQSVVEREKRQRSDLQEQLVMSKAQIDYYTQKEIEAGGDPVDPEARNAAVQSNANYLRKIENLQTQLSESDTELTRVRRNLSMLRSEMDQEEGMDDIERELLRTARLRMDLEREDLNSSFHAESDFQAEAEGDQGDLDTVATEEVSAEGTETSVLHGGEDTDHAEDDPVTQDLKSRFQKTQKELKEMVDSYDTALRTKKLHMETIVEERKRFEAMKAHYESKMAEMNAEVHSTQQQRDELDVKIKALEGKKASEATKAQLGKLRSELKHKNERLRTLEQQAKQLKDAKRMARSWELKEQKVQREIDNVKQQKVASQRKLEETSKRYREETQQRKNEIARLKKQARVLANDKQKLVHQSNRDGRLLKAKSEQVANMQRKLRQAQRFTSHNSKLSEREKKQRLQLEKFATEKLKKEEEIKNLQLFMAKQDAAIEKWKAAKDALEEHCAAMEARAKAAEEEAEKARAKTSIESLFPGGAMGCLAVAGGIATTPQNKYAAQLTDEEQETFEDLKNRLEAAEFEVSFQEKKVIEAAANLSDDEDDMDTGDDCDPEGGDQKPAVHAANKFGKAKADFQESLLNFESIDEAKERLAGLLTMWLESKQEKVQLQKIVDTLKASQEARRKSSAPMGSPSKSYRQGSPAVLFRSSSMVVPGASPVRSPSNAGGAASSPFQDHSELSQLRDENQRLLAILHENGLNVSSPNLQLRALEDRLRDIAVQPRQGSDSRRSSLPGLLTPAPQRTSIGTDHANTPPSPISERLNQAAHSFIQQSNESETSESYEDYGKTGQPRSPDKTQRNVFNRLTDCNSFTGTARARLITASPSEIRASRHTKTLRAETEFEEETLDVFHAELPVDEATYHPGILSNIRDDVSPKAAQQESGETGRASSGSSSSPSFTRPTEAWQSKQRQGKQRESSGSACSSTVGTSKPAFCSTAGPAKSSSKPYPALTESAILQTEQGTYRATEGGLYRSSGGRGSPLPAAGRQAARSRMGAWQAPKQQQNNPGTSTSPKLVEIDNADVNSRQIQPQSHPSKVDSSRQLEGGQKEKENTETDDLSPQSDMPIYEKLSDPKFYTGTQKHRAGINIGASNSTPTIVPAAVKLSMAQERARRKGGKNGSGTKP